MSDQWMIRSNTFVNCNCDVNCGCQFNVPSTHGFCLFVEGGYLEEGYFNDTSLSGLHWAFIIHWPGEVAEGNGKEQVVIDERANEEQREALNKIVSGEAGEPGSNHFSVYGSMCSELLVTKYLPFEYEINIEARTAHLKAGDLIDITGAPIVDEFSGEEFHMALARSAGSFEFSYAEIGHGTARVTGPLAMQLDKTYGQFCVHHYNQDGLIRSA